MRFWDASALVPLFTNEGASPLVEALMQSDPSVVTWWTCRTEVKSALYRRVRMRTLQLQEAAKLASSVETQFESNFVDLAPSPEIRRLADAILSRHGLRAADAYHLAAWRLHTSDLPFVCLDDKLRAAAVAEGATVLP